MKMCEEKEVEMLDIPYRTQLDLNRIQRTCAKYLGSIIPWKPLNSIKKEQKWNYYHDQERKIGWCFNPKVLTLS